MGKSAVSRICPQTDLKCGPPRYRTDLQRAIEFPKPILEIPFYKSEIEAMKPIIISDDLTKIK